MLQRTDDLNASGHPGYAEACWHAEGGQSRHRGRDYRLHPAVVGVHFLTRHFFGPVLFSDEGEDLRGRHDEEVIGLEQSAQLLIPGSADFRCGKDLGAGQFETALDFPDRLGLEKRPALRCLVVMRVAASKGKAAQCDPCVPELFKIKVQPSVLNRTAKRLEMIERAVVTASSSGSMGK